MRAVFLVVLLLAQQSSLGSAAGHDPSVAHLVDWFLTLDGTYYNPKQEIRHEVPGDASTMLGVFANARIKKGEKLVSVPWNATINAGYLMKKKPHLVCDTVHSLVREMKLGDKSEFAPYVKYLLEQRRGQLASAWSEAGKDLLLTVLDGHDLPPLEAMTLLDQDWYKDCDGAREPFEENAAMLVIQRAEDDLMLPVYDMYNHRNGRYLNTVNKRKSGVKFDVTAARTIEKGEQIYISYNMCSNCGNRANSYGTPDMFADYGFVESMPQRWIFEDQRFAFDLQEKQTDDGAPDGSGEIELSWMKGGRPKKETVRMRGVQFFLKQVGRLEKLKKMEQQKNVPDYEWDAIWRYADALVVAMKHAIRATAGDDEDVCAGSEEADKGLCVVSDGYDALDDETERLFYKNVPGGYRGGGTKTCDNAKMMQFKGRQVLEDSKSLYQSMEIFRMPDGDVCLELDNIVQTCAKYRPHYHELVVDFPARYIDRVRRILFVGGGDSMILAEALKYPSIEHVVGLELDQKVVRKCFKYFGTQPHFDDDRVEWWFGDAIKSLRMLPKDYFGTFDLVLVDLSETVASFAVTGKLDMLEALALLLTPNGVMIKNEWDYLDKLSTIFDYTARLYMQDVPTICDQAITMGSNSVDFFHHNPKDHNVKRRLLGPHDKIDDQFYMFHDYQKNDALAQGKCDESSEEGTDEPDEEGTSAGVIMIVDVENTTTPLQPLSEIEHAVTKALQRLGLSPLSTVAPSSSTDGVVAVIVMKEGYVVARAWPEQNYCAFDMHFWGAFNNMPRARDALVASVGGSTASMSSFRIVAGGMLGSSTWNEDQKTIGPRFTQIRNCADASVDRERDTASDQSASAINVILQESMSLVQSKEILALAVCGLQSEPCNSLDVLDKDESVHEVITLWTCPNMKSDIYAEGGGVEHMIDCERDTLNFLSEALAGKESGITTLVMDASTPLAMVKIVSSIFSSRINRMRLLANQVIFMAMMLDDTETRRKKHNFLDRIRKEIKLDPLFTAELGVDISDGRMEVGIMSEDAVFFPHLYNVTKSMERQSGLNVEVRKILGARWKHQKDYSPREYSPGDYDLLPGRTQFLEQKPIGRQSIFQLELEEEGGELSRSQVESALYYTFSKMRFEVEELKTVTGIGAGFVIVAILSEGSAMVVWDGNSHVDVNVFAYDESEERANKFINFFTGRVPNMRLSQRDEQPRGIGRVVNFVEDMSAHRDIRQAEEKGLYECPSAGLETGLNDVAGYFNYYDKDNERHARKGKEQDDYYTQGFRDVKFGGRGQTYSEMKKKMTKYKAKAFGDNLLSGDKIYEGACGEAFNILLTVEILNEERGIENLTAFGSEYLAASTAVANTLFDAQASTREWMNKGKFCQGDSTNLDFVPPATFDLAFTYIDPLVDPLRRHGEEVPFQQRVKNSRKLCESEDESDKEIMLKEQAAQEDWHSSWVKELIRITKPGKVVIIEDVDRPVCDESSDWGGVSVEWWKEAVSKYWWDVDPNSIEIVDKAWYDNRYNVLMRRN